MKRLIEQKLQVWKNGSWRKPLILKGLRQCGKTYLVQEWAGHEFAAVHTINFEKKSAVHALFEQDLEPKRLLKELSFFLGKPINIQSDLLFFDEIQACPKALTSLKYFNEDLPELAVVAAGSLLGIYLGPVSFPVGKVEFLHMYPMSFEEFLMALEENLLLELIQNWKFPAPIPVMARERLWERLTWYMAVGGLPESVKDFCEYKDDLYVAFQKTRERQKHLLLSYYADFVKHAGQENAMHIDRVWQAVPSQLSRAQDGSAQRFQFTGVVPGIDRYQKLAGAIDWLKAAGLVLPTYIVNQASIPLAAFCKESLFKLYACDVGLLGAMIDLPVEAILGQKYGTYKGYFAENFVAQELICYGEEKLICWQQNRSEIEFLSTRGGSIIPIEVKAGGVTRAKSLEKFMTLYHPPRGIIFSGSPPELRSSDNVHVYPLYMAHVFKQKNLAST